MWVQGPRGLCHALGEEGGGGDGGGGGGGDRGLRGASGGGAEDMTPCSACGAGNKGLAHCFAQGHIFVSKDGEKPTSCGASPHIYV